MDFQGKKNSWKNRTFLDSLKHAAEGLVQVFHEETNMKYHVLLTLVVLSAGFIFGIKTSEFLWLLLVIAMVLISEIFNTTIENIVDLIVGESYHPMAKKIKDISAAGVLLSAVFAMIVGMIIFIPYVLNWIL